MYFEITGYTIAGDKCRYLATRGVIELIIGGTVVGGQRIGGTKTDRRVEAQRFDQIPKTDGWQALQTEQQNDFWRD